jgi:hypothetical protein
MEAADLHLRSKWEGLGVGRNRALESKVLPVSLSPLVVLLHKKKPRQGIEPLTRLSGFSKLQP